MEFEFTKRGGEEFAFEHKEGEVVNAEISWTQLGDVMVVDHTFVDDSLRGQGIARQLVERAADYAREKNYKIEPVCSYVASAFEKSTDYDDIKVS
ncbi:GNAT family N-acetyltransferase [Kurthia massiliensis]|uniref:GNAT family N-acetyltransferase n=1 Tax=Kurthia massiliensis TaxID=1033739 RepID=UPI000288CDE2|nr:GNAT family N-acetyltransferase [Kurthia massiliensis]